MKIKVWVKVEKIWIKVDSINTIGEKWRKWEKMVGTSMCRHCSENVFHCVYFVGDWVGLG